MFIYSITMLMYTCCSLMHLLIRTMLIIIFKTMCFADVVNDTSLIIYILHSCMLVSDNVYGIISYILVLIFSGRQNKIIVGIALILIVFYIIQIITTDNYII